MTLFDVHLTLDVRGRSYTALVAVRSEDEQDAEEEVIAATLDGRLRPAWASQGFPSDPGLTFTAADLSAQIRQRL